jgi:hypothetical protein
VSHRVLVFPCGSEVGLEVERAVGANKHFELVGLTSAGVRGDFGPTVYREHRSDGPRLDDPGAADAVARIVRDASIDLVFPAMDVATTALDPDRVGCPVVGSPLDTCRLVRSKSATYDALTGVVPVPARYATADDADARPPLFLKPDVGQGSQGTHLARTRDEARALAAGRPDLLILEYLPGVEHTIDAFTDRHGVLRFASPRRRDRTKAGISVHSRTVHEPALVELAHAINGALRLRGGWFFQTRARADGSPALLEVGARIAGTSTVTRALGVNLVALALYDALGLDVDVAPLGAPGAEVLRPLTNRFVLPLRYRHAYVDLDDTLIVAGRLNVAGVAFCAQCVNDGVAVHLVTRHAGDLAATLGRYRLSGLFDSVHHLGPNEPKSDVVVEPDAVFIDDAWRERREVAARRGVPVFDVDGFEILLAAR